MLWAMKTLVLLAYVLFLFLIWMTEGCAPAAIPALSDGVRFAYAPTPEAAPFFARAAARIRAVSGVELVEDPAGTPIDFVPELLTPARDGALYDCGQTPVLFYQRTHEIVDVRIHVVSPPPAGCSSLENTLAHELIHSLRREYGIAPGEDHSETGLFSRYGGDWKIDEASLNKLCEAVECTTYQPEER